MNVSVISRTFSNGKKVLTETLGNKTITKVLDKEGRQVLLRNKTINKSIIGNKHVISRNDETYFTDFADNLLSHNIVQKAHFNGVNGAKNHINHASSVTRDVIYNKDGQRVGERVIKKTSGLDYDGTIENTLTKLNSVKNYQKTLTDYTYNTLSRYDNNGIRFSHMGGDNLKKRQVIHNCNKNGLPVPDIFHALGYKIENLSGSLRSLNAEAGKFKQAHIKSNGFDSFEAIKDTPTQNFDFLRRITDPKTNYFEHISGLRLS